MTMHVHRWVLAAPLPGIGSAGVCGCGAERVFSGGFEDYAVFNAHAARPPEVERAIKAMRRMELE